MLSPEQTQDIRAKIQLAEKAVREYEVELDRMTKAGLPTETMKATLAQKKDQLAKIKAIYG